MVTKKTLLLGLKSLCVIYLTCLGTAHAAGLKIGHIYGEGSYIAQFANRLSSCIEDASNLPVRVYGGERLGRTRDLAFSLVRGQFDLALLPAWEYGTEWNYIATFARHGYQLSLREIIEYSNDKEILDQFNDDSRHSDLQLIGMGWKFGTIVSADTNVSLEDLTGKRVAGGDRHTKQIVKEVGGDVVNLPDAEILPVLTNGYIDAAIVGEEQIRYGLDKHAFEHIFWAPDFLPMAFPIAVVMNRGNDRTFGGQLSERITEECGNIIVEYSERSLEFWMDLPNTASMSGVRIKEIPDEIRDLWTNVQRRLAPADLDRALDDEIKRKYGRELTGYSRP